MTRERLSGEQIDVLIGRLRKLGIRPGLPVTVLWHFGWTVPPFFLSPVIVYFALSFLFMAGYVAVLTLVILDAGTKSTLWSASLVGAVLFSLSLRQLTARSHGAAILALICMIAIPAIFIAWLLAQPIPAIDDMNLQTFSTFLSNGALRNLFIILLIALAVRRYRFRRKLSRQKWRAMLAETQIANVF